MPRLAAIVRRCARPLGLFVLGVAVFAAACSQAPLYYSNQNQYFLHGLAAAGVGELRHDWLANTRDPTPIFSGLVALTVRWLHPWVFHVYYALLQGIYAAAMLGLFVALVGTPTAQRRWPIFVGLFVAAHAALLRWCSYRWLGLDYPWYLQAGLAGQYILGAILQPSAFGVLLVVAVCLFVHDQPLAAVVCNAVAVTIHSTYLLPAGLLTLGFLTSLLVERRTSAALLTGAVALALVAPVTVYVLVVFGPTSPADFAASQDILANFRIPHHTRPDLWLDGPAVAQLVWFLGGVVLSWRTRLFPVLVVAAVPSVLLTLLQVLTGSNTLALLFPWRISAVLFPIATTVILSRLTAALPVVVEKPPARLSALLVAVGCAVGGVWLTVAGQGFLVADDELPLLEFVRQEPRRPDDVYFLPLGPVPRARGAKSLDFAPLPQKKEGDKTVTVNLQRFRLDTGTPIYVDFKSIPYKDREVLDWYERNRRVREVQELLKEGKDAEALRMLRHELRVTHVVLPVTQPLKGDGVTEVHADAAYRVYRLTPPDRP
jgi:hypothetical protein